MTVSSTGDVLFHLGYISAPSRYGLLNLAKTFWINVFHPPLLGKTLKKKPFPLLMGTVSSWLVISGYTSWSHRVNYSSTATEEKLDIAQVARFPPMTAWNCCTTACKQKRCHSPKITWKRLQPFQKALSRTLRVILWKQLRHVWLYVTLWACKSFHWWSHFRY